MKSVIKCYNCDENEYYGAMHWRDGKEYCRKCIAKIWQDDGFNGKAFDFYFPYYFDGVDYSIDEGVKK